jgi:hypothetical protein
MSHRVRALHGYGVAPEFAWSGWRLRIPGEPPGGQYHGFIAPDSSQSWETGEGGWPGGRSEIAEHGQKRPSGASLPPQGGSSKGPWDQAWGGTALKEGQTHSDYIYRGPAETRPRPNASGGVNVVHARQTRKSAGYAEAPGNYRGLGVVAVDGQLTPLRAIGPAYPFRSPEPLQVGPMWNIPSWGSGATSTVNQPPPPIQYPSYLVPYTAPPVSPQPSPTVAAGPQNFLPSQGMIVPGVTPGYSAIDTAPPTCPTGYTNSGPSGSCMPLASSPQCAVGYTLDPMGSGQCVTLAQASASVTPGSAAASVAPDAFSTWLQSQTIIPGVANQWIALGGVLAALMFMKGGKR